ncbi:MAG: hypothetical protein K6G91_10885 [Kiritimatiellae bacterium]|nr:hypothetical protein [Kiritimatiellia bacterium]
MRKLLVICAATVAIGVFAPIASATDTTVTSLDNPNGTTTVEDGDTLTVTGPVTSTGNDTSTRFNKAGDGTLILKGANNTFKRIKHSAGKLVFDGGATIVSGGTGSGAGDDMNVILYGDETVFTGGATFTIQTSGGLEGLFSKTTIITNATVDTRNVGDLLCNFVNGTFPSKGQSVMTIGTGGVFRISGARVHQNGTTASDIANESKYGINLVDGGMIDMHGMKGLMMEKGRHGFFHIDGGIICDSRASNTYFPNRVSGGGTPSADRAADVPNYWANTPITIGEKGATYSNAVSKTVRFYAPFKTGAADGNLDGGLHLKGKSIIYFDADGSTYTGGLYLDSTEGMLFAPERERAFGAVPETQRDNIFVRGSSTAIFGEPDNLELHANRNVLVSSNRNFYVIAKTGKTLTIHGEINGEHEPGALPTTTRMISTYQWTPTGGSWKGGLVVLDPGEGRTNNVGRLTVEGNTEIKSGTTIVNGTSLNDAAPVYVHGSGAADATIGTLTVSGGELVVSPNSSSKFFQVGNQNGDYGLLDVCGGTVKTSGGEFLNALGAGLTVIRAGGVIDCGGGNFRVAQYMTDNPTVVRLATNGLLRCNQVTLDTGKNTVATFLFDGGYIHPTVSNNSFCGSGLNAAWNTITFAVGPGGAGFETESGNNVWIYRPLVSGVAAGRKDGGLMARGPAGTTVCLMTNMTYNGATTIDTVELQQRAGDNLLPSGTDIVLANNGILALYTYGSSPRATAAALGGVSGSGTVKYATASTFSGTFAPSIGGTIRFTHAPASIGGTILISGDATGCGNVKFDQAQDVSGLTLRMADASAFDSNSKVKFYKIIDAPNGITGRLTKSSDFPSGWEIKYSTDGKCVYMYHSKGTYIMIK